MKRFFGLRLSLARLRARLCGTICAAFFAAIYAILSACTNGIPQLQEGDNLPFELISTSYKVTNAGGSFVITGKCDGRMSEISISFDSESSWKNLADCSTSYTFNCKDSQTFSATLDLNNPVVASYFSFTNGVASVKTLKLHGMTQIGPTRVASYALSYEPYLPSGNLILSGNSNGAKFLTSTNYLLRGRIGVQSSGIAATSTNYILKSGLHHEN